MESDEGFKMIFLVGVYRIDWREGGNEVEGEQLGGCCNNLGDK